MATLHYIQHVPFEGPAAIANWCEAHGVKTKGIFLYEEPAFPEVEEVELLVVLGGPMSVHDEENFSWLKPEKEFIRAVIDAGKPVLGICLGAQLVAEVLGGVVSESEAKEVGWFPVELRGDAASDPIVKLFPQTFEVFHWHGEAFSIPPGATALARSSGCENQAFVYNGNVLAIQFHLETTPESASKLVEHCAEDLEPGVFIQDREEILDCEDLADDANELMRAVLDYLSGRVSFS